MKYFLKEIDYNNDDDKFKLSQYVSELEKILTTKIIEEIISFLVDLNDIKSSEIKNNLNHNLFLFHGQNNGLKEDLINNLIKPKYKESTNIPKKKY